VSEPTVDTYWHTLSDCWCTGIHDMDEAAYMNGKLAERRTRAGKLPAVALAEREAEVRRTIERDARLQDALDALRAAILWLHGDYRDRPRSEFNAEAWYHKARSGVVGLAALADTPEPTP